MFSPAFSVFKDILSTWGSVVNIGKMEICTWTVLYIMLIRVEHPLRCFWAERGEWTCLEHNNTVCITTDCLSVTENVPLTSLQRKEADIPADALAVVRGTKLSSGGSTYRISTIDVILSDVYRIFNQYDSDCCSFSDFLLNDQ